MGYYQTDSSGLFNYLEGLQLVIVDDGDGSYSWNSSPRNLFATPAVQNEYNLDECTGIGSMASFNGTIAVSSNNCFYDELGGAATYKAILDTTTISDTRTLFFSSLFGSTYALCDKTNIPPNRPYPIVATASFLTVTLTWTDNSSDETGFKIFRKDSLTGAYAEIASVAADVTSYADTVTSAGDYWYIMKATNANGDSQESNAVKVTVSE